MDAAAPAGKVPTTAEMPTVRSPPGAAETQALRQTLDDGDASTADIKAKLQAVRDQRKKSEADLTQAREDLKKVLNVRQEAVLVSMGVLD